MLQLPTLALIGHCRHPFFWPLYHGRNICFNFLFLKSVCVHAGMLIDALAWGFVHSCKEERQQYGFGAWEGDSCYCLLLMMWCKSGTPWIMGRCGWYGDCIRQMANRFARSQLSSGVTSLQVLQNAVPAKATGCLHSSLAELPTSVSLRSWQDEPLEIETQIWNPTV